MFIAKVIRKYHHRHTSPRNVKLQMPVPQRAIRKNHLQFSTFVPDLALEHHATYALYCDPRHTNSPRWVPATVTKVYGTRSFTVKAHLRGPLWKRHWEQLRPRYTASMKMPTLVSTMEIDLRLLLDYSTPVPQKNGSTTQYPSDETNPHTVPEYRRHNPRRPGRHRKPRPPCNMNC